MSACEEALGAASVMVVIGDNIGYARRGEATEWSLQSLRMVEIIIELKERRMVLKIEKIPQRNKKEVIQKKKKKKIKKKKKKKKKKRGIKRRR